jgi:hypothetical protein
MVIVDTLVTMIAWEIPSHPDKPEVKSLAPFTEVTGVILVITSEFLCCAYMS